MTAPVTAPLELPEPEEEVAGLKGVLSPQMTGNMMGRLMAANQDASGTLRTCDFDVVGGPLELDADDWDGVSVWVGAIPSHGVCRKDGAGDNEASPTAASERASTNIFLKLYTLTDALEQELNAFGEGIEPDDTGLRTVCLHASNSWALVTFKRREDAEAMLQQGLSMAGGSEFDETRAHLLIKRAISADEAQRELEQDAQAAKEKHEMVVLAVSRIQGWVQRSGKELVDLFAKIDADGSGDFTVQEFRAGMLSIGLTFTDEVINALMQEMDSDGDGEVDVTEFIDKMDKFAHELTESGSSVLAALIKYMDSNGATASDIFAANDDDASGHLDAAEFHDALLAIGIPQTQHIAHEVMAELDMDNDGDISLAELTARLSAYRRRRRAFAAKVLSNVFDFIQKTNASATRIFSRVDSDGSGTLDVLEFQEALRKMGQELTPDQVNEIMSELDLDQSGSISVSEFLDKLKQAESERQADMRKCQRLFEEADKDGSGTLDREEIVWVGQEMGLREQIQSQAFVDHMVAEMQAGHLLKDHDVKADGSISPKAASSRGSSPRVTPSASPTASPDVSPRNTPSTEISYAKFIAWYLEVGKSYMDKPHYEAKPMLVAPSEEKLRELFDHVDADNSGEADLSEVQQELHTLWPYLDSTGFHRAFQAADTDHSGHVDYAEFKSLVDNIIWLNDKRHSVQELEDAFGTHVGEDEFYFGCQCLNISVTDGRARYLFQGQCKEYEAMQSKQDVTELEFDQFITWAVRYVHAGELPETEAQRRERNLAEMSKDLENLAGEYGDVHFMDLVSVVSKPRSPTGEGASTAGRKWKTALKKATKSALECSELVKKGIEYSTRMNDSFPNLSDESLRAMVRMCTKEEYFSGQNIITQGEVDYCYYVLRRGRVDVIITDPNSIGEDGEPLSDKFEMKVGSMEWGMGFGEIGLLLATKRNATIRAKTPCEVYCLDRPAYETVLALLPEDQRLGPMAKVMDDFWKLMTGPDGSRRESVDFKTYLKSHIRTAKTLMTASDMEEFDEAEERAVAQSDWEEDCARYHMKITDSLSKPQYFDAMYQLVYLWSEDQNLSYATFLRWIFDNIAEWDEAHNAFMFRKIQQVECVGDKFEKMKEEARDLETAKEAAAAEVLAAAEAARAAHAAQLAEEEAMLAKEKHLDDKRSEMNAKLGALATEEAKLHEQMALLENEEAELLRRLQSGELSAEEEAAVRARLAEIGKERGQLQGRMDAVAAERAELEAKLLADQQTAQLRELDKKLSRLEQEEEELKRRLASGKLSPEEEADIRARLAKIATEKANVLADIEQAKVKLAQAEAGSLVAQLASEIQQIDSQLTALAHEEAELMRRLASGELTAEEEAEVRARLTAIDEERQGLMQQRHQKLLAKRQAHQEVIKHQLAAELALLDNRLSALDDEEAELLRRLESGDLTPAEEEAVRARLNQIASEREALQARKEQHGFAAEQEQLASALSALDDEEAQLRRRLAQGNLTPAEEAKIRKRLEAIDSERRKLKQRQMEVYEAEERVLRQLIESGVLSPEELARLENRLLTVNTDMEPLREAEEALGKDATRKTALGSPCVDISSMSAEELREWTKERDLRRARELAEADRIGRVGTPELTTAPRPWGCDAHAIATAAHARCEWSAYATVQACREQQWAELDASRLPPKLLAEWHQLRSTLRNNGQAGRGRALAWLSKALREVDVIDNQEVGKDGGLLDSDIEDNTAGSGSNTRSSLRSNFPAPFVPRSSLVKSPRQRQRQRDEGIQSCSIADSVFSSVSSPQLGLDPANGVFTSSYQIARDRSLDEQAMMQLQLGSPRSDTTKKFGVRSRSPNGKGTRVLANGDLCSSVSRCLQLGAGQFDMTDSQARGTLRVFTASYTDLGVGAIPAPLLRGPYMEWEAPDSPYRAQIRMAAEERQAGREAGVEQYSVVPEQKSNGSTKAEPNRRSVRKSSEMSAEATGNRQHSSTSKIRYATGQPAGRGSLPALKSPPAVQNNRISRSLDGLFANAAPDHQHKHQHRYNHRNRHKYHHHSHKEHEGVHSNQRDLLNKSSHTGFKHVAKPVASPHRQNVPRTPISYADTVQDRQGVPRTSSGFSLEGTGRRSPPRPTHNLQWDGPIGTIARF